MSTVVADLFLRSLQRRISKEAKARPVHAAASLRTHSLLRTFLTGLLVLIFRPLPQLPHLQPCRHFGSPTFSRTLSADLVLLSSHGNSPHPAQFRDNSPYSHLSSAAAAAPNPALRTFRMTPLCAGRQRALQRRPGRQRAGPNRSRGRWPASGRAAPGARSCPSSGGPARVGSIRASQIEGLEMLVG